MNAKTYLFVAAWIKSLKALPVEQRWNVLEAITEYATTGQLTKQLDQMETIAFSFIRNEIDRMKRYRIEVCERRRTTSNHYQGKECDNNDQPEVTIPEDTNDANDANACNELQEDAPLDIISVSVSESKSESGSDKKSSSTSYVCVCVRGIAGKLSSISAQRRENLLCGSP